MISRGVSKSGSPTPRLMTSVIVARMSKNLRIPDGGTSRTRWPGHARRAAADRRAARLGGQAREVRGTCIRQGPRGVASASRARGRGMLGRPVHPADRRAASWARPLGDWVHGHVAAVFGTDCPGPEPAQRDGSAIPLHAVLPNAPVGALFLVIAVDVHGQPSARTSRSCSAAWPCSRQQSSATRTTRRPTAGPGSGPGPQLAVLVALRGRSRLAWSSGLGTGRRTIPIGLSIVAFLICRQARSRAGDVVFASATWSIAMPGGRPAQVVATEVGDVTELAVPVDAEIGIPNLVLVREGATILAAPRPVRPMPAVR